MQDQDKNFNQSPSGEEQQEQSENLDPKDPPAEGLEINQPEGTKQTKGEGKLESKEDLAATFALEVAQWKEKYLRLAADFENFKKRSRQEGEQKAKFAIQPFVENLLHCLDDLELAFKHFTKNEMDEKFQDAILGLEMTLQKFQATLSGHGVEKILTRDLPFDPNLHEAVAIKQSEEKEENTILDEFQSGYTLHGRVLRPAKVQVVKKGKE